MKIEVVQGDVDIRSVYAKKLSDDCIYVWVETDVKYPRIPVVSSHMFHIQDLDKLLKYSSVELTDIDNDFSIQGVHHGRHCVEVFYLRLQTNMFESGEVVKWEK